MTRGDDGGVFSTAGTQASVPLPYEQADVYEVLNREAGARRVPLAVRRSFRDLAIPARAGGRRARDTDVQATWWCSSPATPAAAAAPGTGAAAPAGATSRPACPARRRRRGSGRG